MDEYRVVVRGLPATITEDQVRDAWTKLGGMKEMYLNGERGFCFLTLGSEADLALATSSTITIDGHEYGIEKARARRESRDMGARGSSGRDYNDRYRSERPDRFSMKRSGRMDDYPERRSQPQPAVLYDYPRTAYNYVIRNLHPSLCTLPEFKKFVTEKIGATTYTLICPNSDVGYFGYDSPDLDANRPLSLDYEGTVMPIFVCRGGPNNVRNLGRDESRRPRFDTYDDTPETRDD